MAESLIPATVKDLFEIVGAIGSMGAAIGAVWLANRTHRPKVALTSGFRDDWHYRHMWRVKIANVGAIPTRVEGVFWRVVGFPDAIDALLMAINSDRHDLSLGKLFAPGEAIDLEFKIFRAVEGIREVDEWFLAPFRSLGERHSISRLVLEVRTTDGSRFTLTPPAKMRFAIQEAIGAVCVERERAALKAAEREAEG